MNLQKLAILISCLILGIGLLVLHIAETRNRPGMWL